MTTEEKFEEAKRQKEKGADLFKRSEFQRAVKAYSKSKECMNDEKDSTLSDDQTAERRSLLLASHLNLALVQLKLGEMKTAIGHANDALQMDADNVKALFRRGQVCFVCLPVWLSTKD